MLDKWRPVCDHERSEQSDHGYSRDVEEDDRRSDGVHTVCMYGPATLFGTLPPILRQYLRGMGLVTLMETVCALIETCRSLSPSPTVKQR